MTSGSRGQGIISFSRVRVVLFTNGMFGIARNLSRAAVFCANDIPLNALRVLSSLKRPLSTPSVPVL